MKSKLSKTLLRAVCILLATWMLVPIPAKADTVTVPDIPVDIAFVIDTTGSMAEEIYNVRTSIMTFAAMMDDYGLDARFALAEYRDTSDNEKTVIHMNGDSPWFTEAADLESSMRGLSVSGGGDTPETVIDGLEATRRLTWRSDAKKFIIVVTDAGYKVHNTYGVADMDEMISLLQGDDIITSVATNTANYATYSDLADKTTGVLMNIDNDFSDEMLALIGVIFDEADEKVITKISVKRYPSKTTYLEGEYFDPDGLAITVHYSNGLTEELTTGFTCLPDGRLTLGDATITVSYRGFYETIPLTVTAAIVPVTGISLDKTSLELSLGETAVLTATVFPTNATNHNITWYSSDETVITVKNGVVTPISAGEATIWAMTVDGNHQAVCSITVKEPHAHSYSHVEIPATCTTSGISKEVCTCGHQIDVTELPALGHLWSTTYSHTDEGHFFVCTRPDCDDPHGEMSPHAFQWKTDVEATASAPGLKHEECVCGAKRNENTVIPQTGTDIPVTGEEDSVGFYLCVLLLSGMCLAGTLLCGKKRNAVN